MTENFCARTARRIRRFGYPPARAVWLAKACLLLMLSLCGALLMALGKRRAGVLEGPAGPSGIVLRSSRGRRPGFGSLPVRRIFFPGSLSPPVPAIQRRPPSS